MLQIVEDTLKESVMEQLHLPPLRFSVSCEHYDPKYAAFLKIEVTEVFGKPLPIAAGGNYLACGEYSLAAHPDMPWIGADDEEARSWLVETYGEEVAPQVVALVIATLGTTTRHHVFLTPGEGRFELYGHVKEVQSETQNALDILAPDKKSFIRVELQIS